MNGRRAGAWALIVGSVVMCCVFLLHPSHIDPRPLIGSFNLSQLVHTAAILAAPLLLLGIIEMTNWLSARSAVNRLALVCAAMAMMLTVNAAVVSSFVTPAAIAASGLAVAPPPHDNSAPAATGAVRHMRVLTLDQLPPLVKLAVALNRGLAQAEVALLSIALLLFGVGLGGRSRGLAVAGIAVGAFPLLWQLSGRFSPETHTMPLIVFAQSAWLIAVAIRMLSRRNFALAGDDLRTHDEIPAEEQQ